MNKEIRLFSTPSQGTSLHEFLADFTQKEVLEYLRQAFNVAVEEVNAGMIPTEQVELMFDLAEILYDIENAELAIHKAAFKDYIVHLLVLKTEDYNAERIQDPNFRLDDKRIEYFPFHDYSYLQMIHTKINRIESLVNVDLPNFEGLMDSVVDLGSYLIFYYSFLLEVDAEL